jgi:hypothetical protein
VQHDDKLNSSALLMQGGLTTQYKFITSSNTSSLPYSSSEMS